MNELYLLALNLTRRCNLACAHCYMDAGTLRDGSPGELTSAELCRLLDEAAAHSPGAMVVLTGGEPLLRPDLEAIAAHGARAGLAMVVGTNGMALSAARVAALKGAGVLGMGISVDSLDPARHDAFRGLPGAWAKTLAGIEACKAHDLPFNIHFSVTESNAGEIGPMIDFARAVGARVLNVFFLVCTGRGERMSDISPARYEQVITRLVAEQERSRDLIIRARCAPYFKRIAHQRDPQSPLTRAQGYEGGGCMAGTHYCRITPEGGVTACPYIPHEQGNVRQRPFAQIWEQSADFIALRAPALAGKCGECEYRLLCGGCRARPLAQGGALLDADPWCTYLPRGGAVIQPWRDAGGEIGWSPEAEARLARIPAFVRRMVKKRAEDHARTLGAATVTVEHLDELRRRRFGDAAPYPAGRGREDG